MRVNLRRRLAGQRIVALFVAYAFALSALVGSFATVHDDASGVGGPGTILCHTEPDETVPPASGDGSDDSSAKYCSICCLTLAAAIPPPQADAMAVLRTVTAPIEPARPAVFIGHPQSRTHQSQAPPPTA